MKGLAICLGILLLSLALNAQVVINEASNKNFNSVFDENQEAEDWIELYNAGSEPIDLAGYALSDDDEDLAKWVFPSYNMEAGEYLLVFCSGKNRFYSNPFQEVAYINEYNPTGGWNQHIFEESFLWDGTSDLIIDVCSFNNSTYTQNSIFNQSQTDFTSTAVSYVDYSDAACGSIGGEVYNRRPNMQINGFTIGTESIQNGNTDYPAPYGNWYWSARNQMLIKGSELSSAGLSEGPLNSIAWDVASTAGEPYTYISIRLKQLQIEELSAEFFNSEGQYFHTNFKISSEGDESIYLVSPEQVILDELNVDCPSTLASQGRFPNGDGNFRILSNPSPAYSNSDGQPVFAICSEPIISIESGVYNSPQFVTITDTNGGNTEIHYTTNGDEPTENSALYTGQTIPIFISLPIRARAFNTNQLPSQIVTKDYLINVNHVTPILSVNVDNASLYGGEGIFDNWSQDWERFAQVAYYDSTDAHNLLFEKDVAIQIDGGAGGSRSQPQHSFRLELAKGVFGESPLIMPVLSNRPERFEYSKLYIRNGSNQWLTLPYKDACAVEMMASKTHSYYSAMRPVSVYINGDYFGLYEMREKLDDEFFEVYDDFDNESEEILSLSYWYNSILRAQEGNASNYWESWEEFRELNPDSEEFIEEANEIYDLENYTDYVAGQCWIGNTDWPYNNIKIYRSDSTDQRWRFATIDLELSLAPNGWSDCYHNGLEYALNQGQDQDYVGAWNRSMQNETYRNYFINRFADLNNTLYKAERLLEIENRYFLEWILEMPKEYQRWGDPFEFVNLVYGFNTNHLIYREEIECKAGIIRDQIEDALNLEGQFTLTLNTIPEGAGIIHINTIAPSEYPWNGVYYKGIPIEISAEANPGYSFAYWENNAVINNILNPSWNGEIDSFSIDFTAIFMSVVGVEEENSSAPTSLHIYPNPTVSDLYFQNEDRIIQSYEIYDSNGRLVEVAKARALDHLVHVNVESLAEGLYFLQVRYQDGVVEKGSFLKR